MRKRPQFTPAGVKPGGQMVVVLNAKMRSVLARLIHGLTDEEIVRLVGPVASPVKAFGEAVAPTRPPSDHVVVA